jgi:hypothetical protein
MPFVFPDAVAHSRLCSARIDGHIDGRTADRAQVPDFGMTLAGRLLAA